MDEPGWRDERSWEPKDIPFTGVPGPRSKAAALQSDNTVDFVELFLSDDLLQHIVDQTNLYADQRIAALAEMTQPYSRLNAWRALTLVELKNFLGLMFLTGLVRKPTLESYWSQEEATATPYFNKTMPRNRYQLIWRFLHFADSREVDGNDPLHKVRPS